MVETQSSCDITWPSWRAILMLQYFMQGLQILPEYIVPNSIFNEGGVSPPGMDPVLQANTLLQTFEGALKSAQKEVSKEAEDALRSLKCLERELTVERREVELMRKESNLKRPHSNIPFPSFPMSIKDGQEWQRLHPGACSP